jgi:Cu+-exporting ATPase
MRFLTLGRLLFETGPEARHREDQMPVQSPTSAPAVDPVCGMTIDRAKAAGNTTVGETTFYFCSVHCKNRFEADPARFAPKSS